MDRVCHGRFSLTRASETVFSGPHAALNNDRGKILSDPAGANRLLYLKNSSSMLDRTGPYCPYEAVYV